MSYFERVRAQMSRKSVTPGQLLPSYRANQPQFPVPD